MKKQSTEDSAKMLLKKHQEMAWAFVREFCLAEGYVIMSREEALNFFFPPKHYTYLAHFLQTDLGKNLFPYTQRPLREVADELSEYVGWDVDEKQLRRAISRLK